MTKYYSVSPHELLRLSGDPHHISRRKRRKEGRRKRSRKRRYDKHRLIAMLLVNACNPANESTEEGPERERVSLGLG